MKLTLPDKVIVGYAVAMLITLVVAVVSILVDAFDSVAKAGATMAILTVVAYIILFVARALPKQNQVVTESNNSSEIN